MKYIKLFESMTEIEVEKICKKYRIKNWTLNPDGTVDVDGDVNLAYQVLSKLPLKFGRVTGSFSCLYNRLTSLKGCPKEIGGSFWCYDNQLTSLEGCPKEIGGNFSCYYNYLTSLKGAPEYIEGQVDFMPNNNLPEYIKQILELNDNNKDIQKYILKWQKDYSIWRIDGSFNQDRFIQMMQDAGDELPKLKLPK
jgi:hypothetical protein